MRYAILSTLARTGGMASMVLADSLSIGRTTLYHALSEPERRRLGQAEPCRRRESFLSLTKAALTL